MSAEVDRLCRLEQALAELDSRSRQAFLMSAAEGLPYAQIAERLGISTADVERLLADAFYELDRRMERTRRRSWWSRR
jgi:RNA polymerase sigma-70 factor (ECF subfamily)